MHIHSAGVCDVLANVYMYVCVCVRARVCVPRNICDLVL